MRFVIIIGLVAAISAGCWSQQEIVWNIGDDTGTDTDTDSDSDGDVDADADGDSDTDCTNGICCDTSDGTYHLSTYPCDVMIAYSCTSTDCGADAQEQDTTQYCSGTSELCNGSTVVGAWTTVDDCDADAICEYDTTDSWCTDCLDYCIEGMCGPICASPPAWTKQAVDGTGFVSPGAYSVDAADVDGDGDIDVLGHLHLVGMSTQDDSIRWWENTSGDGSTWTEHVVSMAVDDARGGHAADIDGDGDIDVLGHVNVFIPSDGFCDITWWENVTGSGTTWIKHTVDGSFYNPASVIAADVDGDGDMDVLGTLIYDDEINWWENTAGDGTAWTAHTVDGFVAGAISVDAADVDGDGDMDVLGAAGGDDDIAWWENTAGDGTAWTEHTVAGDFDGARAVHATDIDGDGDMDVLGAAYWADDIICWENTTGDGTAWIAHTVDWDFDGVKSVFSADVDGDGDMDVLGAAWWHDDITWWENTTGDGTAWTEHTVDGDFDRACAVHATDIDGDGDMDVLGAAENEDFICWWESDCIP